MCTAHGVVAVDGHNAVMPDARRASWATRLALLALCAFMLAPIAWAFLTAVKPLDEAYRFPPSWFSQSPKFGNFMEAAEALPLTRFMLNSLFISSVAVVGAVLTSAMAGFALARLSFRGKLLMTVVVVICLLIPSQVLMAPRYMIYDWLGWIGTYKPLIVPAWLGGGAFNVLLFRQYFLSLSNESEDAARLDGADEWRVFSRVALPSARPALVTAALLSFVYHWQEFLDPLLYLDNFRTFPVSVGLRMYQSISGTYVNLLMAASLLAMIPPAVLFLLAQNDVFESLGVTLRAPGVRAPR